MESGGGDRNINMLVKQLHKGERRIKRKGLLGSKHMPMAAPKKQDGICTQETAALKCTRSP